MFTSQFDQELRGTDLRKKLMGTSPDSWEGAFKISKEPWHREIEQSLAIYKANKQSLASLTTATDASMANTAVSILIDQSGSMQGDPMRYAAASVRLICELLDAWGAQTEVLGFSTAGWRGGFSRQKWLAEGRPKRPGRVCALLHIVYKSFADPELETEPWEAMLDPNVLRENIDGEAIEWATNRLRAYPAQRKHLLILSDGAPMDDATAAYNGLGYLTRHLEQVLANLEKDGDVQVSAIEIGHEGLYPRETAHFAPEPNLIPDVMLDWARSLAESEPRR